ncbi:hypothetical protein [Falsiroseomonas ponticola]|uniref:hypothetical protein n=1 Tax=Falsiroseomonas ponticola TaxID=2786951 RepID=UPI0019346D3E|nr:hypothetical protein [Roseomonas ponticola]
MRPLWHGAALAGAALLAGCAMDPAAAPPRAVSDRLCASRAGDPPAVPRAPVAAGDRDQLAAVGYSPVALRAADAVGAVPLMLRLDAPAGTAGAPAARLAARQELVERILQGMLDAAGTIAEIDCEGERGDQLRTRLQAVQDRRARQLGVAGLLLGAGTAALTGGLSLAGAAAAGSVAGIAGGAAEASAAGALLFGTPPTGHLSTPRNLLREVWERPVEPRLIPASVWRYLSYPDRGSASQLDLLLAEWRTPEMLGPPGSELERRNASVLFGEAGEYTPGLLEVRDKMLDLLEASIALMHQDLRTLLSEVRGRVARGSAGASRY